MMSENVSLNVRSKSQLNEVISCLDRVIRKLNHKFEFVDLGGGIGIAYHNKTKKLNYKKYSISISKFLK